MKQIWGFRGCWIILAFLITGICLGGFGQASGQVQQGLPFSTFFSSTDYKGGMQNWSITQSREGILYVANNFGLLEYDGTTWSLYRLPSSTKIRDVKVGNNGFIYVAGQADFGFFAPGNLGRLEYVSLADSLPGEVRNFDETWRIFISGESVIYCTFQKLFRFSDSGEFQELISPPSRPESFVITGNQLYASLAELGMAELVQDSLVLYRNQSAFRNKVVTGILPLSQGKMWISTRNNGIFILEADGTGNPLSGDIFDQTKTGSINESIRLSNGWIAVGTQYGGVFLFEENGRLIQHLNKDHGLNNRTVLSLFEDRNRNLWVGHNNGISQVELSLPFRQINEHAGLPGTGYDAFRRDNNLYLGTNNGLYLRNMARPSFDELDLIPGTQDQVYYINQVDGILMLGHQRGAFVVKGDEAAMVSDVPGAWTFLPLREHPDYILGGNYDGLTLFRKEKGRVIYVRRIRGFSESSRVMEQDAEGKIWMTHGYKGVFQLSLNDALDSVSVRKYTEADGLPSNLLINVWQINNRLVFSTVSGIYSYDKSADRFVPDAFFTPFIPPGTIIISMAEDPLGNIYFTATGEMGVLQKQRNGDYIRKTDIFARIHPLLNDDLQKVIVLKANEVLFPAKEGFVYYDNEFNSGIQEAQFQTLIRSVRAGNSYDSLLSTGIYRTDKGVEIAQPGSSVPVLEHQMNSVRFTYSAPYFSMQDRIEYQYRLRNFDADFGEWTIRAEKEYTNLAPGEYTFEVRARNSYGQEGALAAYSFVIEPPWYMTGAAYTIFTLAMTILLIAVMILVDKQYQKKRRALEEKQSSEIEKKNSVLRNREEEIERLRNEKLKAEINSKNKELASTTMLLIHKNSFMNTIKHNLSGLARKNDSSEVTSEIDKIMTTIDKNISQDDGWEQFQIHFDEVHGDFASRIQQDYGDLSPQELKLSAYLRMNLSTKEIAQLMNISVRGVEVARYRLRKKLDLDRSVNLQEFILKY